MSRTLQESADNGVSQALHRLYDKAVIVVYILLMTVNFLGELAGFPRMFKAAGIVVVAYAVVRFIIVFDKDNARYAGEYFAIIAIPIVLVLTVSLLLWLGRLETLANMMDASQRLLVQFINIFLAVAVIYLFKGAAMRYTLYAMSIAYGYIIFRAISNYGISGFIKSLIIFATSLGIRTEGAMAQLEVHDMTFAFGFFVVYYFQAGKKEPRRWLCRILSSVCFILGYKRIAIFGVVIALMYSFYFRRIRASEKEHALRRFSIGLFLFCYAYLFMTRYDLMTKAMNLLGINMMGRSGLYDFVNQYYDISPTFLGYGFNYMRSFLVALRAAGDSPFATASIHNEIVRQFLELGFWGYLMWSGYELLIRPRWMLNRHGLSSAKMYMLCTLYIFITYLTDNTMYYYHTAFVYRLIPLICAQMYHDEQDAGIAPIIKRSTE